MMELEDCAFPLLAGSSTLDPMTAFKDINVALLVGARPRGPGMERKDLLSANAQIFTAQGKALNAVAKKTVKVLVVGNPANTILTSYEIRSKYSCEEFHSNVALGSLSAL